MRFYQEFFLEYCSPHRGAKNRGFKEGDTSLPLIFLGRGAIYFRKMIEIGQEPKNILEYN